MRKPDFVVTGPGFFVHLRSEDDGHMFHEVLEWNRNKFDDALEQGAKALGLPPIEVSLAFPASGIVRAVLVKNMHYTTRLALQWLRPSEVRDVQVEIRRIVEDRKIPTVLRDFAEADDSFPNKRFEGLPEFVDCC